MFLAAVYGGESPAKNMDLTCSGCRYVFTRRSAHGSTVPMNQPSFVRRFIIACLLLTSLAAAARASGSLVHADRLASKLAAAHALREVSLQNGNTLQGSVVDDDGMPQANYEVWIAPDNGQATKTRTDSSGRFAVAGLLPGIYSIDTPCGGGKFRLWEAKDAPREAQSNVLLIVCTKSRD